MESYKQIKYEPRNGFEHKNIDLVSETVLQDLATNLFSTHPTNWNDDDEELWNALQIEVNNSPEKERLDIGDTVVLVGVEMTETNGAVGYRDNHNQNEIESIITGYNIEENMWEVMITKPTLREILGDVVDDEEWQEFYLDYRPFEGGVYGYTYTGKFHGNLSDHKNYRKQGIYRL